MVRTQIQLTEEQVSALRRAAAQQNRSFAEMIRVSVDCYLKHESGRASRYRRAAAVAGRFNSGLADISTDHDRYLAEAFGE